MITLLLASAHLPSPPNFPRITRIRGNLKPRSADLFDVIART
jgi:hypothetical protein